MSLFRKPKSTPRIQVLSKSGLRRGRRAQWMETHSGELRATVATEGKIHRKSASIVSSLSRDLSARFAFQSQADLAGRACVGELWPPHVAAHGGQAPAPCVPHDLFVRHAVAEGGRHEASSQAMRADRLDQRALQPGPGGALEQDLSHLVRTQPCCLHDAATVDLAKEGAGGVISATGLRAGFVTTAYRNGVPDEEIMGHTRHRSLTTMRSYVRRAKLSQASPAGKLGL